MTSTTHSLKIIFSVVCVCALLSMLLQEIKFVEARTETIYDYNNNDLEISMEAPDYWNSGTVSEMISKLSWRMLALNAINDEGNAIFAVSNLPSLANLALPLGQKTGILSLILSQYVTINEEYDITLTDGSSAHLYSISATGEQLHNLNIPINEGLDAVLISTQQGAGTYIVGYATHLGRMAEFESEFQNILGSVRIGSAGFSATGELAEPTASDILNDTQITPNAIAILQGASVEGSPYFDPYGLTVKKGDKITVNNKDIVPHTVTSGEGPTDPNTAKQFDTSIIEAGSSAGMDTTNINPGVYPFYCSVHPYMNGWIVVK